MIYNNDMFLHLKKQTEERIAADRASGVFYGTPDEAVIRQDSGKDRGTLLRPAFVRDCAKIINLPAYSRLQDKTQVLSLYRNDDISHRMLHVQIVSRIARDISRALGLNVELTEAIALGHDLGHTPFGHAGESMLDKLSVEFCGLHFCHNVQSARLLTVLYPCNISLQTVDGVLCHNGEMEQTEYKPTALGGFDGLFFRIAACERDDGEVNKLVPGTIEGCVVRVSDMIAYIGKDRQDAKRLGLVDDELFSDKLSNAEIINNISVDIIENSYGKGYIAMSGDIYSMLTAAKTENGVSIYSSPDVRGVYGEIEPKFRELFVALLSDVKRGSFVADNHTRFIAKYRPSYINELPERQVCDFIASMTDDYFIAVYEHLTGKPFGISYREYF